MDKIPLLELVKIESRIPQQGREHDEMAGQETSPGSWKGRLILAATVIVGVALVVILLSNGAGVLSGSTPRHNAMQVQSKLQSGQDFYKGDGVESLPDFPRYRHYCTGSGCDRVGMKKDFMKARADFPRFRHQCTGSGCVKDHVKTKGVTPKEDLVMQVAGDNWISENSCRNFCYDYFYQINYNYPNYLRCEQMCFNGRYSHWAPRSSSCTTVCYQVSGTGNCHTICSA